MSSSSSPPFEKLNIALVSDFFYPRLGGVEMHIWSLGQHLLRLGHKVIIITHAYNSESESTSTSKSASRQLKRCGVRYLAGPLKVYHCPLLAFTDEVTLPTFLVSFPLLRWIFIRENINLIHAHQATSAMANESIVYASEMGIPSVYTDHSLFGFDDVASLILNKVQSATLVTASAVICVSYTCRENLLLRLGIDPSVVRVIPNAIDFSNFLPSPPPSPDRIKIVVISRLVYRKGADLLAGILPVLSQRFPLVDFIIAGDGAKKSLLVDVVARHRLQHRVEFLGAVPHSQVRDVLIRGHLFLNCSLTESFCIALLEAASCGLFCVSTNVGGVPEVLPEDMIRLADPSVPSLLEALASVLTDYHSRNVHTIHNRVKQMYSWETIAKRTVTVYREAIERPRYTFKQRLERYNTVGWIGGPFVCGCAVIIHLWIAFVTWYQPRKFIDVVPDLTLADNRPLSKKIGDKGS